MISEKLCFPWKYTPQKFCDGLLFHGSSEAWRDPIPHANHGDGCFWATNLPLVAQTYISAWSGLTYVSICDFELNERVRPGKNDIRWRIAQMLGARAEILEEEFGRITSWRFHEKPITYRDVRDYIIDRDNSTISSESHRFRTNMHH